MNVYTGAFVTYVNGFQVKAPVQMKHVNKTDWLAFKACYTNAV